MVDKKDFMLTDLWTLLVALEFLVEVEMVVELEKGVAL
jgi:hypothetical protein